MFVGPEDFASVTWMSQEVSKWLVNGLQPTYKWGKMGYIGVITHLPTIDPNSLGHSSNGDLLYLFITGN